MLLYVDVLQMLAARCTNPPIGTHDLPSEPSTLGKRSSPFGIAATSFNPTQRVIRYSHRYQSFNNVVANPANSFVHPSLAIGGFILEYQRRLPILGCAIDNIWGRQSGRSNPNINNCDDAFTVDSGGGLCVLR